MDHKNSIRVLGEGLTVEIDPKSTPNNNFLVCGETGAGKTTFVINNLISSQNESLIIVDAKSNLYNRFSKTLSKKGFGTERISFIGNSSTLGYNPLDHVRLDVDGRTLIDDIKELAGYIVGDEYDSEKDPFWRHGAQQYVACALALCLRLTPESEHTLPIVSSIMELMTQPTKSLVTSDFSRRNHCSERCKNVVDVFGRETRLYFFDISSEIILIYRFVNSIIPANGIILVVKDFR